MKPTVINRNKHVVSRKHFAAAEFVIFCWDERSTISTLPLMLNPGVLRRFSETAD
jgi:hypothetical protein